MTSQEPANIELDVRKSLTITWYDDHTSVFPLELLRKQCPCAKCVTEKKEKATKPDNPFNILKGPILKQIEALNIEPVGNYAVRFDWSDQHQSGIYTFEFLRKICPCFKCK